MGSQQAKSAEQVSRETIIKHEELVDKLRNLLAEEQLYYAEWCALIVDDPLADLALAALLKDESFDHHYFGHVIRKLLIDQWQDLKVMAENNASLRREIEMLKSVHVS